MTKSAKLIVGGVAGGLVLLLVALGLFTIGISNSLNNKEESGKAAWSQLEAQYQRRADLISQTVPVVKQASAQEGELLEKALKARYTGSDPNQTAASEANLALQFKAVVEAYPNLQSQQRFADLQNQIEGSENRIVRARTVYVDRATEYNRAIRNFPGSMFGRERLPLFESAPGSDKAPDVNFGN